MRRFNDHGGLGPLPWGADLEAWLEVSDAAQIEADIRAYAAEQVAAERARCANKLRHSNASLLLMTGELTPQELRTVHAVLNGIRSQIERA